MRQPRRTQPRARRRGQTLLEFALVLPMLLILSLLLVQFGLILNATITLTNIAREGARYAAVHPSTDAGIQAKVATIATNTPIQPSDISIAISPAEGSSIRTYDNPITVSIGYDMKKKLFLPNSIFFGIPIFTSTYTASATMNIETS